MNGALLLLPIILIRYGLLFVLDKESLKRAAFFPPLAGRERVAYWVYQASTLLLIAWLFFLRVTAGTPWFYARLAVYCLGVLLCFISTLNYAKPSANGINLKGLYRLSRNPMYVAYFICFLGCAWLTMSLVLLAMLIVFQIAAHWIILSEERWCKAQFGDAYIQYMKKVRRYI